MEKQAVTGPSRITVLTPLAQNYRIGPFPNELSNNVELCSTPIFGRTLGSTEMNRPHCKQFLEQSYP